MSNRTQIELGRGDGIEEYVKLVLRKARNSDHLSPKIEQRYQQLKAALNTETLFLQVVCDVEDVGPVVLEDSDSPLDALNKLADTSCSCNLAARPEVTKPVRSTNKPRYSR